MFWDVEVSRQITQAASTHRSTFAGAYPRTYSGGRPGWYRHQRILAQMTANGQVLPRPGSRRAVAHTFRLLDRRRKSQSLSAPLPAVLELHVFISPSRARSPARALKFPLTEKLLTVRCTPCLISHVIGAVRRVLIDTSEHGRVFVFH